MDPIVESSDEAAAGLAKVNLAAAADIMFKPAFRRQQTEELKKKMVAAVAVGDYEAAAQLKKVITATESAIEQSLSAAEVAATEELKQEMAAAVAVEDYERAAELKKAITAIEDKATEVEAREELKKELAAAVAVGDYERAAELKKAIAAAESTVTLASEPRMALSGVARTAPMGATVVLNSGVAYYVHGMERWPDDVDGKCVTVTGILKTVAIAPAGVIREIRVIREIDWRLMSSEPELVPGQSAKQLPVLLPTAGAISDDEHGGPRTIRSRIGRISKEAYDMMTHSDIEVAYDASKSMTMEHGSNLRTPPGPTARPPPPATVAGHLTPSRSTPYILAGGC